MKKQMTALLLTSALTLSAIGGTTAYQSFASTLTTSEDEIGKIAYTSLQTADANADTDTAEFSYGSVADVAEAALPSIVSITNESVQEVRSYFSSRPYAYKSESAGTGIIVGENDTELLICTNNHVVENASEITVSFIDDESIAGQVKGTDPANDLAVVAVKLEDIPQETMDAIRIAKTGDSDQMRIGEQVVAIGNALGYGQSVTTGIISAFDRTIQVSDNGYSVSGTYENLIQTDAAINAGNSGGALLNMHGEVIGINSAKASASGVEGMGYAIPISKALPILEKLMTRETRTKLDPDEMGYIGINGQTVSSDVVSLYGIPAGVYVTYIGEDSPASEADLQEGDIITSFDGETVTSMEDLQRLLQYYKAGEEVEMTINSNENGAYEEKTITLTLGDRSEIQ